MRLLKGEKNQGSEFYSETVFSSLFNFLYVFVYFYMQCSTNSLLRHLDGYTSQPHPEPHLEGILIALDRCQQVRAELKNVTCGD